MALCVHLWLGLVLVVALNGGNARGAELLRGLGGTTDLGALAMSPNDDGSSGLMALGDGFPHGVNFFGQTYTSLYINNNGNITFAGPVGAYTPVPFPITNRPMIAPYWGDVDTRGGVADPALNDVYYSRALSGTLVVTWYYVGYYSGRTDKLNAFQLILTDRSDVAPGDFDVEFRYEQLLWTTGNASGGTNGLGGVAAQVGFDAGDGSHFYSHPASMTSAILDLVQTSNVGDPGVWRFEIRNGEVTEPTLPTFRNVTVTLRLPAMGIEVDTETFTVPPVSIEVIDNQQVIRWFFASFTADDLAVLDFDVVVKNPVGGETRRVSHSLELTYTDDNGNTVYTALGEQTVNVLPSSFQLSMSTDKTTYTANELVRITTQVTNLSAFATTPAVRLSITDAGGAAIADVGTRADLHLAAGETRALTGLDFATGTLFVGPYQVHAELLDETGQPVLHATAPFVIAAPADRSLSATIATSKSVYKPLETVLIQDRITNSSANAVLEGLTAVTTVSTPEGTVFWTQASGLRQLLPGDHQELSYAVPLGQGAAGVYRLTVQVQDSQHVVWTAAITTITVQSTQDSGTGLKGEVSLSSAAVFRHEVVGITAKVENLGNSTVTSLPVTIAVVDPANASLVATWSETLPVLPVGSSSTLVREWRALGDVGATSVVVFSAT